MYAIAPAGEAVGGHEQHALELNQIHLALKRTGMLARWTPESDLRSRNEVSDMEYGKDHNITIEVRIGNQERRFVLAYERTPKPKARYIAICKRVERCLSYTTSPAMPLTMISCRFSEVVFRSAPRQFTSVGIVMYWSTLSMCRYSQPWLDHVAVQRGSGRRPSALRAADGRTRREVRNALRCVWRAIVMLLRCLSHL